MIRIVQDTNGRTYQIWQQQQANSCGVASVWMARGIARQASFAEEEWDLAIRMYRGAIATALSPLGASPSGPMTFDPRAHPADQTTMANTLASAGINGNQLVRALTNEGLNAQLAALSGTPPKIQHARIAYNKPGIAYVQWDGTGSGAHFIVVGRCTSHEVSFLDPWNGNVNQQRNNGRYRAAYGGAGTIAYVIYISA